MVKEYGKTANVSALATVSRRRFYIGAIIWLLCFLFIILVLAPLALANYTSYDGSGSDGIAAQFDVTLTESGKSSTAIDLTGLTPGSSKQIAISVSNSGDTPIAYELTAETLGNLPLELSFNTATGELAPGANNTTHVLTVYWDTSDNSAEFSSEIDIVTVNLSFAQTRAEVTQ